MKKLCANCVHRLDFLMQAQVCLNCFEHSKWESIGCCESNKTITPSINPDASQHRIRENVWEAMVMLYDRYVQIVLTIPLIENETDKISDMEDFFNRIIAIGIIDYAMQLKSIEKDLGITK